MIWLTDLDKQRIDIDDYESNNNNDNNIGSINNTNYDHDFVT